VNFFAIIDVHRIHITIMPNLLTKFQGEGQFWGFFFPSTMHFTA